MGRREIFAGNWKMYKNGSEAVSLVRALLDGLASGKKEGRDVVIFPPALYVRELAALCAGTPIAVGVQNMYHETEGAFTGELSPVMVKDCRCSHVLIGHSERRHVFGEKDVEVNRKVRAALAHGITPVICVGELLDEREKGVTRDVVKTQVVTALQEISAGSAATVVVAYEPVWAIGTGKVATPEIAEDVHAYIREVLASIYDAGTADTIPILYGGSVKADNIQGLYAMKNIDGVLVGGASLKADSFLDIITV